VRTPAMLRLGSQGIDIPAGDKHYTVSDSYVLPVDVEVLAVQPHAHYRALEIQGAARLPDGTEKGLIYIRDWDFRWQHVYRFVTPLALPKGTTVTMRYTYDNSAENPRNPQQPPQQVHWGQRSSDEMGDLWLQVLTRDDRDLTTLVREFQPKMLAEDVIGYETMIRANPADIELHDDVAMLYLQLGRPREAAAHFNASVKLKPQSAAAHFNLATAETRAGRLEEAIGEYRQALLIKPDYANAHNNLGSVLSSRGKLDEAIEQYREALRDDPRHAAAHNNLGHALVSESNSVEALPHFLEALRINPEYADAHYNIGNVYSLRGDWAGAVEHFRKVVRLEPDWAPGLSELAWLLATAPEERLHDARLAVRLAEHAADVTDKRDARVLDVLAAAYAAAGSFDRALATSDAALRLMPGDPQARDIRSRQALYQVQRAYRIQTNGRSQP
jgi:tetratricopeptide (TPR) repeat protein